MAFMKGLTAAMVAALATTSVYGGVPPLTVTLTPPPPTNDCIFEVLPIFCPNSDIKKCNQEANAGQKMFKGLAWGMCICKNGKNYGLRCKQVKTANMPNDQSTLCTINGTDVASGKVGMISCEEGEGRCNSACGQPPTPPPTPSPPTPCTGFCKNSGTCFYNVSDNNKPACLCPAGTSGKDCSGPAPANDKCKTYCDNQGKCVMDGDTPICTCTGTWAGPQCKTNACADCQGKCTMADGVPKCDCTGTNKWGPNCKQAVSTLTCPGAKACQNGGTCKNRPISKAPYCECPVGFSGDVCEKKEKIQVTCKPGDVLRCTLGVTGFNPNTYDGKCESFKKFATCAAAPSGPQNCPDILGVWCNMYFKQLPTCAVTPCQNIKTKLGSCSIDYFQTCYAGIPQATLDKPCDSSAALANCAVGANCNSLLKTYCATALCLKLPDACKNIQQEQADADAGDMAALPGFGKRMGMHHQRTQSAATSPILIAVACVAIIAVVAGVAIRRSRQTQANALGENFL